MNAQIVNVPLYGWASTSLKKKTQCPLAKSVLAGGNVLAAPFFMGQITENEALKRFCVTECVCDYTYTYKDYRDNIASPHICQHLIFCHHVGSN